MLTEARYLRSRGISVIPIKGRTGDSEDDSKRPVVSWKEFQTKLPSMTEIEEWFKYSRFNLAMVTGQISRILTLDIDSKKGGEASIKGKFMPQTWHDKSPNGHHYHFIWTPTLNGRVTSYADLLPGVDIRGDGGYVVLPPSVGFNGQPYEWVKPPEKTPMAYPPSWLVDLLLKKQHKKQLYTGNKPGWIAEALASLKEGNRDTTFVRVAGRLWHDGLEPTDIYEVLRPHAERCDFSLSDLKVKVDQVSKYDRKVGEYVDELLDKDKAVSVSELLSDETPDVEWQVEKVLPKESVLILGGKQGVGKSFLALDLCIELANGGGSWLNRFAVNSGTALYVDEENGSALLKQRLKAMLKAKGIKASDSLQLCIEHGYKLDNEKSVDRLKKKIEKVKPQVVVLDSLRRFHNRNENDSGEVSSLFDVLRKLARAYHCSFVVLDHERKPPADTRFVADEASSDDLRGSNDKGAAADAVLSLKEKRGELYLYHTKSRFSRPFLPVLVQIEEEEKEGKLAVRGY